MEHLPNSEFLRRAIALATENAVSGRGGPFAAVIVRDGKIVGEAANTGHRNSRPHRSRGSECHPRRLQGSGNLHSAGCELYTSCEPCPMCLAASYWARLDAVYYGCSAADAARAGFDDAFLYEEFRKEHAARALPVTQLLGDEAWASFAAWIASPAKVTY